MIKVLAKSVVFLVTIFQLHAQRNYPPTINGGKEVVYKTIDGLDLRLWVFSPERHQKTSRVPAIVFYFGGAWKTGSLEQFIPQAEYYAQKGLVTVLVDYRVKERNNVESKKCVSDAKSAIRWVRTHAKELGVNPDKIIASGGSAGGHLAAATALLQNFDEPTEDKAISSKPKALVLFNPVLVTAAEEGVTDNYIKKLKNFSESRFGTSPKSMSPYHHIISGLPPTIIFHGKDDKVVPIASIEDFNKKMLLHNNRCEFYSYPNAGHGFYNKGKNKNKWYLDTLSKLDAFLSDIGYLN